MLVFYGLGNNEKKYLDTKHNVGRLILEEMMKNFNLSFILQSGCLYAKATINDEKIYFVTTSGYMNNSGVPLKNLNDYFKLDFTDSDSRLIVIQDDSDQIFGHQKISLAGGSAGHKGIQSIYNHSLNMNLDLDKIWRVKIGIRPPENKLRSETFVLSKIAIPEMKYYLDLAKKLNQNFNLFQQRNINNLQNLFNG
jgi:PTH1 family peptidyl-tRNA hydrolase